MEFPFHTAARERLTYFCQHMVAPECEEEMLAFVDLSTLNERMEYTRIVSTQYLSTLFVDSHTGKTWRECSFIEGDRDADGRLAHVIFTTKSIHDVKVKELEAMERLRDEMEITAALSRDYPDVVLLDLANDASVTIKRKGSIIPENQRVTRRSYHASWDNYISKYVLEEDKAALYAAISIEKVKGALEKSDEYSCSYRTIINETEIHYYQASFIRLYSQHNTESQIILGFRCVDAIVEEERKNRTIQEEQFRIIGALSQEYSSLFKIDAKTRTMTLYRTDGMSMDLSGKRALLVEDNDLNAEIAAEILGMTGILVERAADGMEAVDRMEDCPEDFYDIIFMDIQMPRMNGYDAARAIRSMERSYCKKVPIVAMTANAFAEDVLAAKTVGMNEHIAKPLDLTTLARILKRWVAAQSI